MKRELLILGAGGVGRETAQMIFDINHVEDRWDVLGFLDDDAKLHGAIINGLKVLGPIEWINNYNKEIYAVCGFGFPGTKEKVLKRIDNANVKYACLVHPGAQVSEHVELGEGVIVQAGCVVSPNVKLGAHVQLNPQCGVGHDSVVGELSSLFWDVSLSGHVKIGKKCVLGTKSAVIQGLSVGENSIVGSCSNVIRDIPANSVAVGNPAKVIKANKCI